MLCTFGTADAPVTVTEQDDWLFVIGTATSAHVVELNTSLATEDPKVIVPIGFNGAPAASVSVTVMVTVVGWFTTTGLFENVTALIVVRVVTVRFLLPLLAECALSAG